MNDFIEWNKYFEKNKFEIYSKVLFKYKKWFRLIYSDGALLILFKLIYL